MKLIRDGKIAKDELSYEIESPKLPLKKPTIVDYEVWESTKGELLKQDVQIGVKLKSDQSPDLISKDLEQIGIVVLEFPLFRDGRPFSYAVLLRSRYNYKKEIRAVGNVLQDQFNFLQRCGFSSVKVSEDIDEAIWKKSVSRIKHVYQWSVDKSVPIKELRKKQ